MSGGTSKGPPAGDPALDITGSLKEREIIRGMTVGLSIITTFEGDADGLDALYVNVCVWYNV